MAVAAILAVPAGHSGFDGHAVAGSEGLQGFGHGVGTDLDHGAGELVTHAERLMGDATPDAAGFIHVQIGAADANGVDLDENLTSVRSRRGRVVGEAEVERAVKADGVHGRLNYSLRKSRAISIRVARMAGTRQAPRAMRRRAQPTMVSTMGSWVDVS